MIQTTCITKFKDNRNIIIKYRLKDARGIIKDIAPQELKTAIKNGMVIVDNLALTSDNRLISKTNVVKEDNLVVYITASEIALLDSQKNLSFKTGVNVKTLESKADLLGTQVKQIKDNLYKIESSDSLLIVTDMQKIRFNTGMSIFSHSHFNSIDLRNIDTSNITDMERIFRNCKARSLNLAGINTTNVVNMDHAFSCINVDTLDLRSLNTSNVNYMREVFSNSQINKLIIDSFDTSKVITMKGIFSFGKYGDIDMSHFDYSYLVDFEGAFHNSKIKSLNLGNFNINPECMTRQIDLFFETHIGKLIINTNKRYNNIELDPLTDKIGNFEEIKHIFKIVE